MNLPNKITISRIVLIVLTIVALFVLQMVGIFNESFVIPNLGDTSINIVNLVVCIVFVIAASTDFLDGYIARSRNLVTDLGKFLDPLADKLLINSMLIFLCAPQSYAENTLNGTSSILVFLVIIMIIRDLAVDGLRLLAVQKKIVVAANIFGKLKTVFQMVTIPVFLLGGWPFNLTTGNASFVHYTPIVLMIITTIMSVASGIIYFIQNRGVFKKEQELVDEKDS